MSEAKIVRAADGKRQDSKSKHSVARELERHGYVADRYSTEPSAGALFRHAVAPSLILHDDGRIELPSGQRTNQALLPAGARPTRIRWSRTLLFLALLCATIFLGLIVTALIVG